MLILGIDPGIARTGWGLVKKGKSKFATPGFGCIETPAGSAIQLRLGSIFHSILEIIEKYDPDMIVIEELFFNTNAKTALIVGQARGVILLSAAEKKIPIFVYTPLQVKMAVTGYGRAEKMQVGKMVKTLLNLKVIPSPDDITDSLAVALTHAFTYRAKL